MEQQGQSMPESSSEPAESAAPGAPPLDVAPNEAEAEAADKLEMERRIVAAEEVVDDLEDERPLPDPELNLLTIVALLVSIPTAALLYRSKMYGAMLVPAILGTALAVFWILRSWSAIMVARMHRRTADALRDLIMEARKDGRQ
jgi:hypothetical protein